MKLLLQIPLLVIVLCLFNGIIFTAPEALGPNATPWLTLPLPSGVTWTASAAEMLVVLGIILLYLELFKATRTSISAIIEHVFSLFVFLVFLIEFIVVPGAGNSTCVMLMLLALLDVIGGFTISISSARRDMNFE